MNVKTMRIKVTEVYGNTTWRDKVAKMDDKQVIAIYHEFLKIGHFDKKKKKSTKPDSGQITIDDILNGDNKPMTYAYPDLKLTIRVPYGDTTIGEHNVCPAEVMLQNFRNKIGKTIEFGGLKRKVEGVRVIAGFIFIDLS